MTARTRYDLAADVGWILEHQHENGAYVASPGYSQYPFCWLRDGSFIAHAMDAAGEHGSARRFHGWVARAVVEIEATIRGAISARRAGEPVDHERMPPARFTLDGRVEDGSWPNFQIDGYGQWLWSLREHVRGAPGSDADGERDARGDGRAFDGLPADVRRAAGSVADYLEAFWSEPCYDAWEEGRTQLHTSTLASACAGLRAAAEGIDVRYRAAADAAWAFVEERCVIEGGFVKAVRNGSVDASLLWLATPFGLVGDDDPRFRRTIEWIEADLVDGGGVRRYPEDTFYGGGAWILLTAWLAWHHARNGRADRAGRHIAWIDAQRAPDGGLPEQVPVGATDDWFHDWWTERWGPSAAPLLWSHAMSILARAEVERATG